MTTAIYTFDQPSIQPISDDERSFDAQALYAKAQRSGWGTDDLPWHTSVDPEAETFPDALISIYGSPMWTSLAQANALPQLRHEMTAYTLSNFFHGEQGGLLAVAQLVGLAPHLYEKLFMSSQVADEARHIDVFGRYLREKYEVTYPIDHSLQILLDTILAEPEWDIKCLGTHVMMEGLAAAALGVMGRGARDPLIRQLIKLVLRDEARHVAFGIATLKDAYAGMTSVELRERETFVLESARLLRHRFLGEEVWERMGLPAQDCLAWAEESQQTRAFRLVLFGKIVPNIKRIGLWTPAVTRGFSQMNLVPGA